MHSFQISPFQTGSLFQPFPGQFSLGWDRGAPEHIDVKFCQFSKVPADDIGMNVFHTISNKE